MDSKPKRSPNVRSGIFAALAAGFSGLDMMQHLASGGAQAYRPKPGKHNRCPYTRHRTARFINRRRRRLMRMERSKFEASIDRTPPYYIAKLVRWDRMKKRHLLIDECNVPIAGNPEIGTAVDTAREHFQRVGDIPDRARIVLQRP